MGTQYALEPQQKNRPKPGALANAFALFIAHFIGYLRWTQLAPMVLVWGFLILCLILATLLNFQEQSIDLGTQLSQVTGQVPGLNEKLVEIYVAIFSSGTPTATGGIEWKDGQITDGIFKVWGYLSLFLLAVDTVYQRVFRRQTPVKPATLRRKLIICAIASAVLVALFFAVFFFSNLMQSGQDPRLNFVGYGVILWLIGAYSLTASHVLGRLSDRILQTKS